MGGKLAEKSEKYVSMDQAPDFEELCDYVFESAQNDMAVVGFFTNPDFYANPSYAFTDYAEKGLSGVLDENHHTTAIPDFEITDHPLYEEISADLLGSLSKGENRYGFFTGTQVFTMPLTPRIKYYVAGFPVAENHHTI